MESRITLNGFSRLVAAGTPLVVVETVNEARTEALIRRVGTEVIKGMPEPHCWNCIDGFAGVDGSRDPLTAIQWAVQQEGTGLYLFKDLLELLHQQVELRRVLKEFFLSRPAAGKTLVFIGRQADLPLDLMDAVVVLSHGLPDRAELTSWFQQRRSSDPQLQKMITNDDDQALLVLAAQGLDLPAIERALRLARVGREPSLKGAVAELYDFKKQILRSTGIMEFVVNDITPDSVGGMENLKSYMGKREAAFGREDLTSGRNLPRGVLIMGISGCGKSLLVKAIAGGWNLPLVRLDMASVYDGVHGSPESSLRLATETAEALSPCVLWIDEIEAGISSHGFKSEGGAASRVLGYFLTWMQEKKSPVFVAATANAIELLPAEVLRKGRFDEIFYVDLPDLEARHEIFRIHLRRRGFDPETFSPDMLAHSTKGFAGAEIEQAVASAAVEALAAKRDLTQQDVMNAVGRTVPLSVTMAEQIKQIENWAFKRAVPAAGAFRDRK